MTLTEVIEELKRSKAWAEYVGSNHGQIHIDTLNEMIDSLTEYMLH